MQASSPSSYVVLGLLAIYGPMTPYDLKKSIDGSVGYFWPFPRAQFYVEPERLKELGLLTEEREPEGRRRRTYSITNSRAARHCASGWWPTPTSTPRFTIPACSSSTSPRR